MIGMGAWGIVFRDFFMDFLLQNYTDGYIMIKYLRH